MASYFLLLPLFLAFCSWASAYRWLVLSIDDLSTTDDYKRISVVKGTVTFGFSVRIKCPKPYVIYPRNNYVDATNDPRVFVEAGGNLEEVPISEVVTSFYGKPIVRFFQDDETAGMEINYPGVFNSSQFNGVDIIRNNVTHLFFLCSLPSDYVYRDMGKKLIYLNVDRDSDFTKSMKKAISRYLKEKKTAVGVISLDIRKIRRITHGCGSIPTPFFANETQYEEQSGVRSCNIDIMKHPDVGFYCDGTVQPSNCFNRLLDGDTGEETYPRTHINKAMSYEYEWHFASYDRKRLTKKFTGYCQCIDKVTGDIKAKITIMTDMSPVCDIKEMLVTNMSQPITGKWCDVGMIPGSTLTIRLPANIYGEASLILNEGEHIASLPVKMNSFMYPSDMSNQFLNHSDVMGGIHSQNLYSSAEYVLGDALQIDQSKQEDEGIITVRYREGMTLSYPLSLPGFSYTWKLLTNPLIYAIKGVIASITIIPVTTHDYNMHGCEPPTASVFSKVTDENSTKQDFIIYGHKMRICETNARYTQEYGLYCLQGHTMLPSDCGKYVYDSSLQRIEESSDYEGSFLNTYVSSMLVLRNLNYKPQVAFSKSCSCVDESGVENAKVVIHNYTDHLLYPTKLGPKLDMTMIVPSVNIVNGNVDGKVLPEVQEIQFPNYTPQNFISMTPGMSLTVVCSAPMFTPSFKTVNLADETEPYLVPSNVYVNTGPFYRGNTHNQWDRSELDKDYANVLPLNMKKYFYQHIFSDNRYKMVPVEYSRVLGTNSAGFRVETTAYSNGESRTAFDIKYPASSIVVSKFSQEYIDLKYLCAKFTRVHKRNKDGSRSDYDVKRYYHGEANGSRREEEPQFLLFDYDYYAVDATHNTLNSASKVYADYRETRTLNVWGTLDVVVPTTDPYLRGCGIADKSEELFREDTIPILNDVGNRIGCEVDISKGDASFYCPLPYVTEPPNCIPTSSGGAFTVKQPGGDKNKHFYIFTKDGMDNSAVSHLQGAVRGVFECHCVTNKGLRMTTIRVYA